MRKDTYRKSGFGICIAAVLLFIILSRSLGITYNLSLNPDEVVFAYGSKSLAQSILHADVEFSELKEYPEGAYVLQLPFQMLREAIGSSHWFWKASRCWSRISSVFYFVLAVIYGVMILTQYMSKSKLAGLLYTLTMCFSLFFIEHSRYGVGDMGSLWLLMAIIYHSARGQETDKKIHLAIAFFCTGALGAVKYPLLFFAAIPIGAYLHMGEKNKKTVAGVVAFLLITVLAFLMFSPKAALDPAYFLRVLDREGKAYVTEGTGFNSGGFFNNVIGTVLYTLLYSDFPLSLLLVAVSFWKSVTDKAPVSGTDYLFKKLLPIVVCVFFAYNLWAKLLVFRTLTPFFGMTALYGSEAASELYTHCDWKERKAGRIAVVLLTCLMVLRGGLLLQITGKVGDDKSRFTPLLTSAVDDQWNKMTILIPYDLATEYSLEENMECPQDLTVTQIRIEDYNRENGGLTMAPGELVVTGGFEFGLMAPYFVSYEKSLTAPIDKLWVDFKQINQQYYVGQIYPSSYYYLFGGWIRGGTLSTFLMPCNMVYYRSV